MSSRTSAGKKKVKRNQTDSASEQVKPQVVKVEFTPPPPQVVELKLEKEKQVEDQRTNDTAEAKGINWRVVGLFSALFPLIGTGILFMLGWAYEVSWYGYFGVNVSQVNTTAQNILIQSIPAVITFITASVIAVSAYSFSNREAKDLRLLIQRTRQEDVFDHGTERKESPNVFFDIKDWFWVDLLALTILFAYLLVNNRRLDFGIMQTYEIFYLQFFVVFGIFGSILFLIVLFGVFGVLDLVIRMSRLLIKHRKEEFVNVSGYYKRPQQIFIGLIMVGANMMILLALSSSFGINDASDGIRGSGGWRVPIVMISSSAQLPITNIELVQGCVNVNCIYGPFGFIGESDNAYTLIQWQKDKDDKFPQQPGIYIIPRSDSTFLVPASP